MFTRRVQIRGAHHGLLLDRWVPPRIQEVHLACCCQVHADTTRLRHVNCVQAQSQSVVQAQSQSATQAALARQHEGERTPQTSGVMQGQSLRSGGSSGGMSKGVNCVPTFRLMRSTSGPPDALLWKAASALARAFALEDPSMRMKVMPVGQAWVQTLSNSDNKTADCASPNCFRTNCIEHVHLKFHKDAPACVIAACTRLSIPGIQDKMHACIPSASVHGGGKMIASWAPTKKLREDDCFDASTARHCSARASADCRTSAVLQQPCNQCLDLGAAATCEQAGCFGNTA
eukprot:363740-Chlamydomonas_euryale.AAC.23